MGCDNPVINQRSQHTGAVFSHLANSLTTIGYEAMVGAEMANYGVVVGLFIKQSGSRTDLVCGGRGFVGSFGHGRVSEFKTPALDRLARMRPCTRTSCSLLHGIWPEHSCTL